MKYLWIGLLLTLAACGDTQAYQGVAYTPPPTPGGRMCIDQCAKSKDYCEQTCDLDNRACYNDVQASAQRDYDNYTRQRFASHASIDMLPSDFEHPDACLEAKKKCLGDCARPHDACYRNCGGAVTVTTSCQFLCF